jgi:hypothetical protein
MQPLLLLALLGGGLYLVTRKNDPSNAPPGGKSKELLTDDALTARFEKNLAAFAAAAPYFDKERQVEARSSFIGDDDRDRAIAMAEFAVTGENAGGEVISVTPAGKEAARLLSYDYRDKFDLRQGKGALADAVIAASVALAKKAAVDPKAWASDDATKQIDGAMVKLIVDAPFVAMVKVPITKSTGVYDADYAFKEPLGNGQVSVGTGYRLMSQSMTSGDQNFLAYVSKVLTTVPVAGKKLDGKYAITFAPATSA